MLDDHLSMSPIDSPLDFKPGDSGPRDPVPGVVAPNEGFVGSWEDRCS
jgi:hypothetical protein